MAASLSGSRQAVTQIAHRRRPAAIRMTAFPFASRDGQLQQRQCQFAQTQHRLWHINTTRARAVVTSEHLAVVASLAPKQILMLGSTISAASAADLALPTVLARALVGAALTMGTLSALLFPSGSSTTSTAFPPVGTPSASSPGSSPSFFASSSSSTFSTPMLSALPVLHTQQQFDAFVVAANRAGYLAVVMFHAPWCRASHRMESELQRIARLVAGRRVVFALVDCSVKPVDNTAAALQSGRKSLGGSAAAMAAVGAGAVKWTGADASGPLRPQRCDLAQAHRVYKAPTVRMYLDKACVDEVVGCRPVDFRQAVSDLVFRYKL